MHTLFIANTAFDKIKGHANLNLRKVVGLMKCTQYLSRTTAELSAEHPSRTARHVVLDPKIISIRKIQGLAPRELF